MTHVLLAQLWLLRRADAASVIGVALEAKAAGAGHRPIAQVLGLPASTVRGWLRRLTLKAGQVRADFTRMLLALDPMAAALTVRGSALGDVVEVVGRAAAAAVLRFSPVAPWEFVARASGGLLLAPPSGTGR